MITKQAMEKTRKYVKTVYSKGDIIHNWENHIEFVVDKAKYIAKKEGMDTKVVEMGALLHDIGYTHPRNLKEFLYGDHATPSARKAERFMKSLKLDKAEIEHVLDTILYHSGKNINKAKTREAKAVYDADKLNSLGPKGFIRVILWDNKYEKPKANMHELYNRAIAASKKRVKRMTTNIGKQLAIKYHSGLKGFIKAYEEMDKDLS